MSDPTDKDSKIRELEDKLSAIVKVAQEEIVDEGKWNRNLYMFFGLSVGIFTGYLIFKFVVSDPKDEFIALQDAELKTLRLENEQLKKK
jgi:hypothetical protein